MSAEKDKVDLYVSKESIRIANIQLTYGMCKKHNWIKHGFGYKCKSCEYYTGYNIELNKLIEKLKSKKTNHE